jgi:putative ATPase
VNTVIESTPAAPVPLHLRNAPTGLMKQLGYAKGYQHAHVNPDAITDMACLPESLSGQKFYEPTNRGFEQKLRERLDWLTARRTPKTGTDEKVDAS